MAIKIVIGILVLTAVTYVLVFVVLPRVRTNANQSVLYQSKNPSTASRQENTNPGSVYPPGNSGNPATPGKVGDKDYPSSPNAIDGTPGIDGDATIKLPKK